MDRVTAVFNNLIKSERYSRFTLQPEEDGERHVEVKLSDDPAEDGAEAGRAQGSPSFRPAPPGRSRRSLCLRALGLLLLLLVFVTGFVLGFASHRSPQPTAAAAAAATSGARGVQPVTRPPAAVSPPDAPLSWEDITKLLSSKLSAQALGRSLSDFDVASRSAGSAGDVALGNRLFDQFKKLDMQPWTDIHYVQLQTPDSDKPNRVVCGSDFFQPEGFLAYSATGKVQGKLVYCNYGRPEDLAAVQSKGVELQGSVLLLRAGKISFAEQVENAAAKGAAAVLVYPDPQDYKYLLDTALYGHVHMGSGDPYTPGFPSFNHTQFAPTRSSGLPKIPAQTLTANMAATLLQRMGGPEADGAFKGGMGAAYTLGGVLNVSVEVNNVLANREIHNVFGVIKGFEDPDRYVVLGAQRDAWGRGYARATVGTAMLLELARAVRQMVEKDGFRPRRSLVFASWSAGEYGSVGATEWLEGYTTSIDRRVVSYINLDGAVMGRGSLVASASPLLHSLLQRSMKEVRSPLGSGSVYDMVGKSNWEANVLRPLSFDDPAYPFVASFGIPSISFHFISPNTEAYGYYGTSLDNMDHLNYQTNHHTSDMCGVAAQLAGQMALRLAHDHLLPLDVGRYGRPLTTAVARVYRRLVRLSQSGQLQDVSPGWLTRARGSFQRAADSLVQAVSHADPFDAETCRILNDRMMTVEHSLLSPYVSPVETPFRHLLLGRGAHTLESIANASDVQLLRTQLALATWNLQGCANAMVGQVWDIDDEI